MPKGTITNEQIAERAFELFRKRGGRHGNDLDDWLHAEQELQVEARSKAGKKTSVKKKVRV